MFAMIHPCVTMRQKVVYQYYYKTPWQCFGNTGSPALKNFNELHFYKTKSYHKAYWLAIVLGAFNRDNPGEILNITLRCNNKLLQPTNFRIKSHMQCHMQYSPEDK